MTSPAHQTELDGLRARLHQLAGQVAAASDRVAPPDAEQQPPRPEADAQRRREAELERDAALARAAAAEERAAAAEEARDSARSELVDAIRRIEELEDSGRAASTEAEELRGRVAELDRLVTEAREEQRDGVDAWAAAVDAERRRLLELYERLSELAPEPRDATRSEPPARHLLFLLRRGRYVVESHDGPPPPAGATVVRAGRSHVVAKVGRGPLPGDGVCAYLVED